MHIPILIRPRFPFYLKLVKYLIEKKMYAPIASAPKALSEGDADHTEYNFNPTMESAPNKAINHGIPEKLQALAQSVSERVEPAQAWAKEHPNVAAAGSAVVAAFVILPVLKKVLRLGGRRGRKVNRLATRSVKDPSGLSEEEEATVLEFLVEALCDEFGEELFDKE
jgi:hypothetical protein